MRIYVIDEKPIVTKMLSNFMRDLGHEVTTFDSTSPILDNIVKEEENGIPDIILVNLGMSEEQNVQMVRDINSRFPDAYIIAMSSVLPFNEARTHGVQGYLDKPISLRKLELFLSRLEERRHDSCP